MSGSVAPAGLARNILGTSGASGAAGSAATPATTRLGGGSEDYQKFLTLLTAQIRNQDPLSPMDATTFVTQLAQLSQVEQQTKTNATLERLASAAEMQGLGQQASLIGKRVQASTASVSVPQSGALAPVNVVVENAGLSNLRLEVLDAGGTVLRRIPVAPAGGDVTFDGNGANGRRLAVGDYALRLVGENRAGVQQSAGKILGTGVVSEVRRGEDGAVTLLLQDGRKVSGDTVRTIGG